mmetsp:Transcript_29007/g.84688  ORF Transcript_29007/g.84688 Transcript_29007/m.84688 type:complete len:291 (-) Transcript_29007:151-1023(-)
MRRHAADHCAIVAYDQNRRSTHCTPHDLDGVLFSRLHEFLDLVEGQKGEHGHGLVLGFAQLLQHELVVRQVLVRKVELQLPSDSVIERHHLFWRGHFFLRRRGGGCGTPPHRMAEELWWCTQRQSGHHPVHFLVVLRVHRPALGRQVFPGHGTVLVLSVHVLISDTVEHARLVHADHHIVHTAEAPQEQEPALGHNSELDRHRHVAKVVELILVEHQIVKEKNWCRAVRDHLPLDPRRRTLLPRCRCSKDIARPVCKKGPVVFICRLHLHSAALPLPSRRHLGHRVSRCP